MVFFTHIQFICAQFGVKLNFLRILHSAAYSDHTSPLFCRCKVLKFVDLVSLENCIFVNKCFNDEAFSLFSNHFKLTASSHSYCTMSVSNGLIFKKLCNTFLYGNKSIINSTVSTWNYFQTIFHGHNLLDMSPRKVKSPISIFLSLSLSIFLSLNIFLRTMKNSPYVFTIIVNIYLMYEV